MHVLSIAITLILIQCSIAVRIEFSGGIVQGYSVRKGINTVNVFKNVPFAEPPVGDLRFKHPKLKQRWHGIQDGTKYARPCMSNTKHTTSPQKNVSEDCLYLNIFADERCLRRACPILYYVHGGNFYYDSAIMFNDTEIINKYASDNMIFIIPAYRLGIFGFMDLGHELEGAPYNVGFHDLILALRWVQKEGHRFGGDVKRITCMGNSGGASAVEYLMVTPVLEPNVFNRVIISSGELNIVPHISLKMTRLVLQGVKCDKFNNGTELPIELRLKCLRQKSSTELVDAQQASEEEWSGIGPQTDKVLFPGDSYAELLNKYYKAVPMLITSTTEEMSQDANGRNLTEYCRDYFSLFGYKADQTANACVEFYEGDKSKNMTRDNFHATAVKMAIENTQHGQPAFVGIFGQKNHSHHANDLSYFFGLHPIVNKTVDDKLMDLYYPKMIKQFIKKGVPEPDWEPVNKLGQNYYYLAFEQNKSIVPHLVKGKIYNFERVNLWLNIFGQVEWNATHNSTDYNDDHLPLFQQLVNLPSNEEEMALNSTGMFSITSSQVWAAFWAILSLAIILATIILVMTASRLMFNYQTSRGYTLATAGEGSKILTRTVRKYV